MFEDASLGQITTADARAESYATIDGYLAAFERINGLPRGICRLGSLRLSS
jgi:hypothetical protein